MLQLNTILFIIHRNTLCCKRSSYYLCFDTIYVLKSSAFFFFLLLLQMKHHSLRYLQLCVENHSVCCCKMWGHMPASWFAICRKASHRVYVHLQQNQYSYTGLCNMRAAGSLPCHKAGKHPIHHGDSKDKHKRREKY